MARPLLQVVLSSTRPGRVGKPVADWFVLQAEKHGGFEVELVDLAVIDLPFFNEPKHPRFGQYVHEHTKSWSETVSRADAFVFVTPEYNYAFNAVLKNALDYLSREWAYKPAGIVSYGGVAAGTRAAQMLKHVLSALKVFVVTESVNIPFVAQFINADGEISANEIMTDAASVMLDELENVANNLVALRA